MIHLKSLELVKEKIKDEDQYPFNLPLVRSLERLSFDSPVTILVGENGSGKSTLLEALAFAVALPAVGAEEVDRDETLNDVKRLGECFRLSWRLRTHRGFFLRAEDFFNFVKRISQMRREMQVRLKELEEEYRGRSAYALSLARMPYVQSLYELEEKYGENLDANSHGESFLKLFQSRFVPNGLYLMDEPETPLSPMRQLGLISMLKEMVSQNSQFIIATHSPILMAFPGAVIYNFDERPVQRVAYEDLEHVRLTRDFLRNPEQYLRYL